VDSNKIWDVNTPRKAKQMILCFSQQLIIGN